eukprot:CAMPEP_0180618778 /NCGR_PEP_ID=MMETSP1037_2-20121125/33749_1 /TAXON_ID=632150 /ORGANISM="Azadinium spinosum, Strain 3D9" /LENGTH=423 /DNA_ID=CAMNT_0022638815 /DNA_START=8 /DNA_END=1279 /DNA_ORIENTATION=+
MATASLSPVAAFFLPAAQELQQAHPSDGGGFRHHLWVAALLAPPLVVTMAALAQAARSRVCTRQQRMPRSRGSSNSSKCSTLAASAIKVSCSPPPPTIGRDIELKVVVAPTSDECDCGGGDAFPFAVVTLDGLAPGQALLRRARCCLGQELGDLALPSGEALNLVRPLSAQGLATGDTLTATLRQLPGTTRSVAPVAPRRPLVEVKNFSFKQHVSEVSRSLDHFEVTVASRQEPEALIEAVDERAVRVDFEEERFTLTIRGRTADYVLRRGVRGHGGMRGDQLPVGFDLCSARCSFTLTPQKKVELTLRPFPENWVPVGTRVSLRDLQEAPELNGLIGEVVGFFESEGKFVPERYCVRLDSGGSLKKLKRRNLTKLVEVHAGEKTDAADAAAGASRGFIEGSPCRHRQILDQEAGDSVPADCN